MKSKINENIDLAEFFEKLREKHNNSFITKSELSSLKLWLSQNKFVTYQKNAFGESIECICYISFNKIPFSNNIKISYSQTNIPGNYDSDATWFNPQRSFETTVN